MTNSHTTFEVSYIRYATKTIIVISMWTWNPSYNTQHNLASDSTHFSYCSIRMHYSLTLVLLSIFVFIYHIDSFLYKKVLGKVPCAEDNSYPKMPLYQKLFGNKKKAFIVRSERNSSRGCCIFPQTFEEIERAQHEFNVLNFLQERTDYFLKEFLNERFVREIERGGGKKGGIREKNVLFYETWPFEFISFAEFAYMLFFCSKRSEGRANRSTNKHSY